MWDLLKMQYIVDMLHRRLAGLPWAQDDAATYRNTQYHDLLHVTWESWDPEQYFSTTYSPNDESFESWAAYVDHVKGLLYSMRGGIE